MTKHRILSPTEILRDRIESLGSRATYINLVANTTGDSAKFFERLRQRGIVYAVSKCPTVFRFDAARMVEATQLEPKTAAARPKPQPKVKLEIVKPQVPNKKQPHKDCGRWILDLLEQHGELCINQQIHPWLKASGREQTVVQINNALKDLMASGKVQRRKSYRRMHGSGVHAYSLASSSKGAA